MTWQAMILWLLLLSLTGTQNLDAAGIKDVGAGPSPLETVQQKLQLVKMLLAKSPALERATRSDDASVKQQTATIPILYANASDALKAGDAEHAEKLLDEALQLIENATHQTPDPARMAKKQQARYTELLEDVNNLLATFHDLRLSLSPPSISPLAEPVRVSSLMGQAKTLAQDRHYREAVELLESAHAAVISSLNQLLKSKALMYDSHFKSPAEEFEYELSRYRSYEELVPIAYTELKPGEDNVKLSAHYVQESRTMRDLASQQAMDGD